MTGFSKKVRAVVTDRAAGRCELCGVTEAGLQYHHRRPRGMGGSRRADTNQASNCALLCPKCHCLIESNRTEAKKRGWLVRQGHNPAQVPVFREGRWVLLDDHGCVVPVPKESA